MPPVFSGAGSWIVVSWAMEFWGEPEDQARTIAKTKRTLKIKVSIAVSLGLKTSLFKGLEV
jgi:hypothetical protein